MADVPDGFEVEEHPTGWYWRAKFWVEDGGPFGTRECALEDLYRCNPNAKEDDNG